MMLQSTRSYPTLPGLPERGPLPPIVGVVIPLARTNLVTNPSFELATTGYTNTGTSINRSAAESYFGAYSLQVNPSATVNTGVYYTITLTAGVIYGISCRVLVAEPTLHTRLPGKQMKLWIGDTSGNMRAAMPFVSSGRWQWIRLIYHEQVGATRRIYITKGDTSAADTFYVDGVQCEAISDGVLECTTYIDGDQKGLLIGQSPAPYLWNGTPHASTSTRSALTRAGGYVLNLQSAYGFLLTGMIGLGMAVPNNISIPYSVLDGARYLRTQKPPRTISFPGRFQADDILDLASNQSAMRAAFDRDRSPQQQPLILQIEPQDECGNVIGDLAQIPCVYSGGLEGDQSNYPVEEAAPTFTLYAPYLIGGSSGSALTVQSSVTGTRGIAKRSPTGQWLPLDAGVSAGNPVYTILVARDGKVYAGGGFTAMSGVANTAGIAYFDPADNLWHAMGSGAAGGDVFALAEGPGGQIYAGGTFTGMGGVANTKCIAQWDGSSWSAMGSGGGGSTTSVRALAINGNGNLYVGGNFTDIGGSGADYLARWTVATSAWSVVGSAAALNGTVYALAAGRSNPSSMYVGGAFTNASAIANADYIAYWNGAAYSALSTGMNNDVNALAVLPNGVVVAGGAFTLAGGVTVAYNAQYNGQQWSAIGTGLNATMYAIAPGPGASLYFGGAFSTAGSFTLNDGLALWTGSAFAFPDVDFGGTATVYAIAAAPDGSIYFGSDGTSPLIGAAITTVTNSNQQIVYPTFTINGPSSGSSRIYSLFNIATDAAIYFDLTISAGETVTLVTDPQNPSFRSNLRGDISGSILSGSTPAQFYLAPGSNDISFFAADSSVTATVNWQRQYAGYADLVN